MISFSILLPPLLGVALSAPVPHSTAAAAAPSATPPTPAARSAALPFPVGRAPAPPPPSVGLEGAVPAAPSSPLTLEDAVATALARSPRREAAAAIADGARKASQAAGRWPNPTIELSLENVTGNGWRWTPPLDPALAPGLDAFAVVSQAVELGGKRGARRALAGTEADAAAASLSQVEHGLVLEIVRLYLDALGGRESLRALEATREAFGGLQQAMGVRVREGVAAEADLAKFQAEAARLQATVVRTRIDLARSLALLGATIGSVAPVTADQLVEPAPRPAIAGEIASLTAAALGRSPDVRTARAREARAASALTLQRSHRVPDLTVAGGYKRTSGFDTAVVGVTLPIPLFDRNEAGVAQAAGEARAATLERADVEARVAARVRASLEAARLLQEHARLADEDILKPADTVRNAARAAFREGASAILNLVDAERVYLDARREILQLRLDALAAAIEARLLLGEEFLR